MLLAAVTGMARAVPLGLGYRLADVFSRGHRSLSPGRRRAVETNLRVMHGGTGEIASLTGAVFRNYGRFLFEFLRGPDLPEVEHTFEGWAALEAVRARGRGVILAGPHTGNWEISGSRIAGAGIPVHAVAGVQLTRAWTRELRRRQDRAGIRILSPGIASWRRIPSLLARNEAVALLVDGDVFRGGIPVRWFGRGVPFPTGPARLAARTGAGLLPAYSRRRENGSLCSRFLEEVPVPDDSPAAIRRATETLAARFEEVVRRHPEQWLIFRRFFPDPAPPGAGGTGRGE